MDEFKFVLKCLLISCVIVIFSQTRISGDTLENKAAVFFKYSETAHWVRAAADGGVKLIRQGVDKTQNLIFKETPKQQISQNMGLFRKLERKEKAQQLGETAEPELNNDDLAIEE